VAGKYRDLHKLCTDLRQQLTSSAEDPESIAALPELDEELLERVEKVAKDEKE